MDQNPSPLPSDSASRRKVTKWTWRIVFAFALLLFAPYVFSRVTAPASRLKLIASGTTPSTAATDSIRIACYNIAHGRGLAKSNWEGGDAETRIQRLDQIADLLKEIDADVVVLNEVDFDASWSNHVNQAEYLARECGYPIRVEERNLDFRVFHRSWRFGNAVLSRMPLSNATLIDLPSFNELETLAAGKKRAFAVDVAIENRTIHLVAAHLSHRSEEIREKSVVEIIKHVRARNLPTVVAGDMNSSPRPFPQYNLTKDEKNAIETFRASGLFNLSQESEPEFEEELTFPSDEPKLVIDWLLFTKELDEKASYRVIDSKLSDHRPIVADFRFKSSQKQKEVEAQDQ